MYGKPYRGFESLSFRKRSDTDGSLRFFIRGLPRAVRARRRAATSTDPMIVLFEDRRARGFEPIALTRHVSHLLVGAHALRSRVERAFPGEAITLHGRAPIVRYHGAKGESVSPPGGGALFVNARALMTPSLAARLAASGEWILRRGEDVVAARLEPASIARLAWEQQALDFGALTGIAVQTIDDATLYDWIWDLIADNGARLVEDFAARGAAIDGEVMSGAMLVGDESIAIAAGARVRTGAIIDATDGPIMIDEGAEIMPGAILEGPCYIGPGSRVKIGAKIYGQTSIGPACKVGGEIENSIVLGFSNKQHDGFLGHSYLGAWVNLGADTNTSDLKNNYGRIRVTLDGVEVDTGRMFLGALIGDHSKTGINTMLNTGTVVGVAANIFGGGFPAKSIPSFAWGGSDGFETFRLERAIELARTVMARRSIELTAADEELLTWLAGRGAISLSPDASRAIANETGTIPENR
jgi:UDP-N-acetylglucosamine diphosphorylase / glucose-1-phosphate thymidylyltransferase / UDP-N-acetylgalactosamine diphosphorylase / glucosamine-1-phosphate N-acetyltransferase / galactosamine-1-phosphate N-acetyltransferase